jgi:hypothetical protein
MAVGGARLRVIYAAPALVLAQVFIVTSFAARAELDLPHTWRFLPVVLLPVVVGLQHRSVWVVLLACSILMALLAKRLRGRLFLVLGGGILVGSLLVLFSFGTGIGGVGPSLEGSALEAFGTQRSTLLWRVEGWKALLGDNRMSSGLDYLLGLPLGSGYLRAVFGSQVGVSPHNFYITIFLRTGLLGLCAFALMYLGCLRPLFAAARQGGRWGSWAQMMFVLLVSQLLFYIPYGASYEQGLLLGSAMGLASWVAENSGEQTAVKKASWIPAQSPQS